MKHRPRPVKSGGFHLGKNATKYPTAVLESLIHFARQGRDTGRVWIRVGKVGAHFSGRAHGGGWRADSGAIYDRRVMLRIGPADSFPLKSYQYPGLTTAPVYDMNDWMEAFVHLAAHEFTHCEQFTHGLRRSEIAAELSALRTLERFRAERQALGVDAMMAAPTPLKDVKKKTDDRLAHAEELLAKWERKAKLAATKIKKLKTKIARLKRHALAQQIAEDLTVEEVNQALKNGAASGNQI